ncbi:MAG TPA: hypothetical protein VMI56_18585, partial [Reyranella sp.]|nr:hypothetical protein [Reyranella sp.]
MKRSVGTVSVGVRAALGMDRLSSLSLPGNAHRRALAAARQLSPETRHNIMRAVLMTVAAFLGFWGFQITAPTSTPPQDPWMTNVIWSNIFKTLQLLTTQFPNNLPTELPWQLQIA